MVGSGTATWKMTRLRSNIPTVVQMRPPEWSDRAGVGADRDYLLCKNCISRSRHQTSVRVTSRFGWWRSDFTYG